MPPPGMGGNKPSVSRSVPRALSQLRFPVESHFKLPILVNKDITYRVFSKSIHKFEVKNDVVGLWNSQCVKKGSKELCSKT